MATATAFAMQGLLIGHEPSPDLSLGTGPDADTENEAGRTLHCKCRPEILLESSRSSVTLDSSGNIHGFLSHSL